MQESTRFSPTVSTVEKPTYLFVKECAAILRLSYRGMYSILISGEGPPYVKLRKNLRIPREEFEDWLKSRTK
jgi:excisionase family DNA binding protein